MAHERAWITGRYRGRHSLATVLLLALLVAGCGLVAKKPAPREDPLVGRIVDARSGEEVDFDALVERAAEADVIYIGEKHDNEEHHRNQLALLSGLLERGLQPAVGFEFFDVGQSGYLMQYVTGAGSEMPLRHGAKGVSAEEMLRSRLGWQERDDRDWQYYFELVEVARENALPVFGADLPAGIVLRISRSGQEALNAVEAGLLVPSDFDDESYRELMYERFKAVHCGFGEENMLRRLYQSWLARNERMAASVVQMQAQHPGQPVLLIVGNGHVEGNRGVYERVAAMNPALRQLNLGLTEVASEPAALEDYLRDDDGDSPRNDFVWLTRRQDYEDPCAAFAAQQ